MESDEVTYVGKRQDGKIDLTIEVGSDGLAFTSWRGLDCYTSGQANIILDKSEASRLITRLTDILHVLNEDINIRKNISDLTIEQLKKYIEADPELDFAWQNGLLYIKRYENKVYLVSRSVNSTKDRR